MGDKALLIVSGHNELGGTGHKTGFWWEELVAPYYEFVQAGFEPVIATPRGGKPLADPRSDTDALDDPDAVTLVKRFKADAQAMDKLAHTLPLAKVNPDDYRIVFLVGGHGAMWDLADNPEVARILRRMDQRGSVISAVCHGPAAFKGVTLDDGHHLLERRRVTGFSDVEEEQVGLSDIVPFSLEQTLRDSGARFSAAAPWQPHAVVDGNLVTGQNPMSSRRTAQEAISVARASGEGGVALGG